MRLMAARVQWMFWVYNGVNVNFSGQIGLPGLADTWTAPHVQYADMLFLSFVLFWVFFEYIIIEDFREEFFSSGIILPAPE